MPPAAMDQLQPCDTCLCLKPAEDFRTGPGTWDCSCSVSYEAPIVGDERATAADGHVLAAAAAAAAAAAPHQLPTDCTCRHAAPMHGL